MGANPCRRLWRWTRRWAGELLAGGVVVYGVAIAGWVCARDLLTINRVPARADVIIVLGGEPKLRAVGAWELFRAKIAPRILISGHGDADIVRENLIKLGVPAAVIDLENDSKSTWENAAFALSRLGERQVRSAVIVTTWTHSRRAMTVFARQNPGVHFGCLPVRQVWETFPHSQWYEFRAMWWEYFKLGGYWLRYGDRKSVV